MQVINYKVEVDTKIDFIKRCVKLHCYINDISISKTAISIMAYLIAYGVKRSTIDLIKQNKFVKNEATVDNIISSLRKKGLIVKEEIGSDSFPDGLNFNPSEGQLGYIIKIKNNM